MAKIKSAWWRPQSLADLGRLSDGIIRRQEKDYVAWLRERWGCSEEDALNIIQVQRDEMEDAVAPRSRVREERWLSERVCVRSVRTHDTRLHWQFSPPFYGKEPCWHWCRLDKPDAPTTYAVVVDGRLRDSFLTLARARKCAELIAATECS